MAVISANISFNRGGHELLDYSSKHLNYSAALAWAQDKDSNAAVGQFIYIEQAETIEGPEAKTYAKGAYIVEAIGGGAVLSPLSKSVAGGDIDVTQEVTDLKSSLGVAQQDITNLKSKDTEFEAALANKADSSVLADKADKSELSNLATKDELNLKADQSALSNLATKEDLKAAGKVKDVTVNGVTVLDEDGTAKIDLSKKADKTEIKKYELVEGANAEGIYASQYEFKVDGEVVTTINIAKDQFLKEAKFIAKAVEEDQLAGAVLGDPYLKFTWQEESQKPTYVPVKELVKTYTADNKYITIEPENIITFNIEQLKSDLNSVYADKSIEETVASHTQSLAAVDGQIDAKITTHQKAADAAYAVKDTEAKVTALEGKVDVEKVSTAIDNAVKINSVTGPGVSTDGKAVTIAYADALEGHDNEAVKASVIVAELNKKAAASALTTLEGKVTNLETREKGYTKFTVVEVLPEGEIATNTIYIIDGKGSYVYIQSSGWKQVSVTELAKPYVSPENPGMNGLLSAQDKAKLDAFGGEIPLDELAKILK